MPLQRQTERDSRSTHEQLLDRIARRYEELEGQLAELEAKLLNADFPRPSTPCAESDRPRQPR